jgi:hypothetical protein
MKKLKQLTLTLGLTLVLAVSAIAGEIQTGVVNPPPPPQSQLTSTEETEPMTNPGDIDTGVLPSDLGTEIILTLLQVLSVY